MSNKRYAYLVCTVILIVLIVLVCAIVPTGDDSGVYFNVKSVENSNSVLDHVTPKNFVVVVCEINNDSEDDIFVKSGDIYLTDADNNKIYVTNFTKYIDNGFTTEVKVKSKETSQYYLVFETEKPSTEVEFIISIDNYFVGQNFPVPFNGTRSYSLKNI